MKAGDGPAGDPLGLTPEQFARAFPFHFALDRDLRIIQAGSTLARVCPDLHPGACVDGLLHAVRPQGRITFDWLLGQQDRFVLLQHEASGLQLRGEFIPARGGEALLFIGSPWFTDSAQIAGFGLGFEDFAVHDPVVDLLLVLQASKVAVADGQRLADKLRAQRAELQTANNQLRAQQSELRTLAFVAARTVNAVILTDAAGRVVWVNEGFQRVTGYTIEDVRGRKPGQVLQGPGTDVEAVRRIRKHLRNGEGFRETILNYRKDGRSYWVSFEVQPIHDEEGELTNFMAIQTDITMRRATQQRLTIQFEVSRVLAEAKGYGPAFARLLKAVCESLGWQVGQLWRRSGERLLLSETWQAPGLQAPGFLEASRNVEFSSGEGVPGRVWESGRTVWIADVSQDPHSPRGNIAGGEGLCGALAFPVMVRGELWGVVEFFSGKIEEPDESLLQTFSAVGQQIGQFIVRKQTEDALQATSMLQRAILDGASYAIISTSTDGIIKTFNHGAERMLGYTAAELVGRATPEVFHDREEVAARAAEMTRELGRTIDPGFEAFVCRAHMGAPDEAEWTYIRKDGGRFPVSLTVTALIGPDGQPSGYLGVASDITERRRAAHELTRARDAAEAANRSKSEFLAMMSHEIRTPMNAIIGLSNLLLDTPLNPRQLECLQTVSRSGEALLELINDILDFSKIESGRHFQIEVEEFSLRDLVADVISLLRSRAEARKLSLEVSIAADLPDWLEGDDGRLRQVLVNLVGNAIKFTEAGGVSVRVRRPDGGSERDRIRFEVEDTGPGVSDELRARLFEPFSQGGNASGRKHGGTGLGLAISRRIVELMGGRIGMRGAPGGGALFWFELSLREVRPSAPSAPPAAPVIAEKLPPLRILLAEDNETNRRVAQFMLEKLGQRPDFAGNGAEAVEAWERQDYDLILMDCSMPEMDGFEATRAIRKREAARGDGRRVAIVALTANAMKGDRERCLECGMDGHISKPLSIGQLRETVEGRGRRPAPGAAPAA
jgi:PAS domain S-box-containing protein